MFTKIIRLSFYLLFILVPLVFLPNTSELFEFNKIIITYLLTGVIVASWLARMITQKKWLFRHTPLDIPLLIFLGINLLSLVFSIDIHTSWFGYYSRWNGGLASLISYALLYWAFVSNMDAKSTLRTIQIALWSCVLVALWGVAEHFGADKDLWVQDVQSRVFSTLGQPNWLAAYIAALIFIPIAQIKFSKKFSDWLNIAIFVLLFCVLLFTKSRSGLLAFGVSSLVFWFGALWQHKTKIIKNGLTVGSLIILLTLIIPNPIRDILTGSKSIVPKAASDTVLEVGGTESGNIRKIVWTGAIRIWQGSSKNFLIGTGPETFAMAYYQYRPIEHNQTSEWELLYNKAHNEFLNYLATTGILGLLAYLLVLTVMAKTLTKGQHFYLLAGWLTISITNFLGFSVVIVQLLLFLIPAFASTLNTKTETKDEDTTVWPFIIFAVIVLGLLIGIGRYWLADVSLASAQKQNKYFQATQDGQYLVKAYQDATDAFKLNNREPVIASELSNAAAYLALALPTQSSDSARQLAQIALATSDQAIMASPYHPNYYKSRARSLILLSDFNPSYLGSAAKTLEAAMLISPTDPRLPFNLGVVYKYLNKPEEAKKMFIKSLELKPDFADPKKQLDEMKPNP